MCNKILEVYKNNFNSNYNVSNNCNRSKKRKYAIGDLLQVINTQLQVHVIGIGNEQYECRLPNGSSQWFYEEELIKLYNKPQRTFKYSTGILVHIINSDINATIIRIGREQYKCRLPDMSTQWFYEEELEPIN